MEPKGAQGGQQGPKKGSHFGVIFRIIFDFLVTQEPDGPGRWPQGAQPPKMMPKRSKSDPGGFKNDKNELPRAPKMTPTLASRVTQGPLCILSNSP